MMMRKLVLLFSLSCSMLFVLGQKKKQPAVLVVGDDILAFTAAIQSARSNVPTLWVLSSADFVPELAAETLSIDNYVNLDGGIWMEILMETALTTQRNDSLAAVVKRELNPRLVRNALDKIVSKQKDLTVVFKQSVTALKRNKKTWTATLSNKRKYELRSIFDASADQYLQQYVGNPIQYARPAKLQPVQGLTDVQLKTMVASGQSGTAIYGITLSNLLLLQQENLLNTYGVNQLFDDRMETIPLKAQIGQAYGALAAYLAFFKTDVEKVDIRKLQSELLVYNARIVPYQDLLINDPNFVAIQKIGLTNLFKGQSEGEDFLFDMDASVQFEEVKRPLEQLFYRSQLWFLDHQGTTFTWREFLNLLKFVGLRGDEIEQQLIKDWSSKLKFKGEYSPEGLVTRYQFATLLERYASPYVKTLTQDGQLIN